MRLVLQLARLQAASGGVHSIQMSEEPKLT